MPQEHRVFHLIRRAVLTLAAPAVLLLPFTLAAQQTQSEYRHVHSGDLLGGYLDEGTLVETRGHLGVKNSVFQFKPNQISAMYPIAVLTNELSDDVIRDISQKCAWDGLTVGGCTVVLRGRVNAKGSRSFTAYAIVIEKSP